MIYALVGRPRSGKSYEAVVYHIIPAIQEGRKVKTNIPLNIDHFRSVFGDKVDELIEVVSFDFSEFGSLNRPFAKVEDYKDDWRNDKGQAPLLIIDEAHMVIPVRHNDAAVLEWYSMHGHYGFDVLLLTQNLRKIHKDVKAMIEVTYYVAKNTVLGTDKEYTKKVRIGDSREDVNVENRKYKSEFFPFYTSHTGSSKAVTEAFAKDVKPALRTFKLVTKLFIFGGLGGLIYTFFFMDSGSEEPTTQQEPVKVSSSIESGSVSLDASLGEFGPLTGYDFFATGYAKQIAYSSYTASSAEINRSLTFYNIYIDIYREDIKQFSMTNIDLEQAGYQFDVLSDCVYKLTWSNQSRVVTCKMLEPQDEKREKKNNEPLLPV